MRVKQANPFTFLVGGMAFGRQLYFMLPNIGYLDSVQEGTSFLLVGMIVLGESLAY